MEVKTFKDLDFKPHSLAKYADKYNYPFINEQYSKAKQAIMYFENGYGVSVLYGSCFYSNGIDTYEVGILYDGGLTYDTDITDDVMGYLTESEVTDVMIRVQQL